MSITSHALHIDFPQFADQIQQLQQQDHDFKAESDRYHELDKTIRGLEGANVPVNDDRFNQLKRERAQLKDHLYRRLNGN